MDRSAVAEMFRQILEGTDIQVPSKMLKISATASIKKADGAPYTIATNLLHTVYWQRLWLSALKGAPRPPSMEVWTSDWKEAGQAEWGSLRAEFLGGLEEAHRIALSDPFEHKMETDDKAIQTLIQIAVHASYHIGQINLLKRMDRGRQ